MKTNAPSREDLTEALLDSASDAFDRARSRALARLRKAGLADELAVLSLLACLTETAEKCTPEVSEVGTTTPTLAGDMVPFRRSLR